ncbi:probable protein phosphatase 2C T23F11.1 [Musca domestica]|uniref:protein-serine/threonine phosphatase n=1 Tax=Musca domestica TaxID=7370 RepID=A0ABM3V3X2_MUSDO|nr:probable protein phosphatase 2C T23F11.1 [Musca domestica]
MFKSLLRAYPDVETRTIDEGWEFLVLACDGIWDVMTNQEVIDFCRARIGQGMHPEEICEELMNHCLAPDCQMGGLGGDNMTVVLVCFLHNKPYAELVARCASSSTNVFTANNTTMNNITTDTTTTTATAIKTSQQNSTPSSPEDEEEELDLK